MTISEAEEWARSWLANPDESRPGMQLATTEFAAALLVAIAEIRQLRAPVPMLLACPMCHERHIDEGAFATEIVHHTHACQHCGMAWRPAIVPTIGVRFLPGFKNEPTAVLKELAP